MNDDGTVSLEFPQFTFPHLPEEVLSFGELHGLGSSPSLFEAHLPAGRPFERIGDSCHKIQARTRLLDDRIQKKDVSTRQKEMTAYYQSNYIDALAPKGLVSSYLMQDFLAERESQKYDPFLGNCLYASSSSPVVLYPTGKTLSRLGIFINRKSLLSTEDLPSSLEFKTPIRQITGIANPNSPLSELIAVRTWDGVSFLDLSHDEDDGNPYLHIISTHRFLKPPLHVALHPELNGQAVVILEGGSVCLWDSHNPLSSRLKVVLQSDEEESPTDALAPKWKSCVFGSHPRQAFIAHPKRVDLLDLNSSETTTILELEARLYAIARHPTNPFQLALATSKSINLYDTRYMRQPLFNFVFQDHRDPYSELSFVPTEGETRLVGWNKVRGEVMSFTYGAKMGTSEAPQPPSLTCVQQLSPSKSNLVMDKELHSGTFFRFKQDHYNNMKEDEEFPPWPRLLGVVPAPKNRDALTIYYFFEDGALYKTGFRTLGSKEVIDGEDAAEMRQREERMSGEEQLLLEEEARLPDLIHDHVLFNAKQLINEINEEIQANADAPVATRELPDREETVSESIRGFHGSKYYESAYEMYFRESYQPLEQEPQTGQALYAPWLQPSHVLAREFSQEMEVSLLDDVDNADQHHKFIEICPPCLMPPPYPATEERDDPVSVFARRWVSRQLYLSSRVIAPSIPRLVETEMDSFEREIPGLDSGPLTLHLPNAEAPIHLTSSCGAYRKRWINPRRYFPGLPGLDLFPDPNDATSEMLLNEEPTHALPRETPVRLASSSVIVPASGSAPPTIRSSARPSSIFSSQSSTQFATPSSSQVQAVHQSTPVQRIGLLPSSQMTSSQLTSSQATPSQMPSSQFSVASSQRRLNSQQQQQSKSKGKARKKGF